MPTSLPLPAIRMEEDLVVPHLLAARHDGERYSVLCKRKYWHGWFQRKPEHQRRRRRHLPEAARHGDAGNVRSAHFLKALRNSTGKCSSTTYGDELSGTRSWAYAADTVSFRPMPAAMWLELRSQKLTPPRKRWNDSGTWPKMDGDDELED